MLPFERKKVVSKILRGAIAALAVSTIVAAPAMATPVAFSDNGWTVGDQWVNSASYDSFYIGDVSATDEWYTAHPQYGNSYNDWNWDGHGEMAVAIAGDPTYFDGSLLTDNCTEETIDGDYTFSCDEEELQPGIFVHPEYRGLSTLGIERIVWVFRNANTETTSVTAYQDNGSECDGDGYAEFSNGWTGSDTNSDADIAGSNWEVQREGDSSSTNCAIEAQAWQLDGAEVTADVASESDLDDTYLTYTFDVPAGGTKALAFFYASVWIDDQNNDSLDLSDPTDPYVVARQASFDDGLALIADNLTELNDANSVGLDADLDIVNWTAADSGLAGTGFDSTVVALGAVALLALGGAFAIRRRARA
ncbi:MAG: hypothetical protein RLZ72_244 [Actinomycetota bacterium]|jgi:MYXO-CTERM domain-containing protein